MGRTKGKDEVLWISLHLLNLGWGLMEEIIGSSWHNILLGKREQRLTLQTLAVGMHRLS